MRIRFVWLFVVATAVIFPGSETHAAQLSDVKTPRRIKDVPPVYPEQSLAAGDEGTVLVELKVDSFGSVTDARVLWSKCPALDKSALEATRKWQYEEVRGDGRPQPFGLVVQVPFRLPAKLKSRAGRPGACRWIDPPKATF